MGANLRKVTKKTCVENILDYVLKICQDNSGGGMYDHLKLIEHGISFN
jgi:hypothetical protein